MVRRPLVIDVLSWGIFALLGTLFVMLGLAFAAPTVVQLFTFARADGRVIDYIDNGRVTYPISQFTTPDGRHWQFQEKWGSNPPEFKLEQRVDVRYDPANPRDAFINSSIGLWILPIIFCLVGGVFALIGYAGIFSVFRHHRAA